MVLVTITHSSAEQDLWRCFPALGYDFAGLKVGRGFLAQLYPQSRHCEQLVSGLVSSTCLVWGGEEEGAASKMLHGRVLAMPLLRKVHSCGALQWFCSVRGLRAALLGAGEGVSHSPWLLLAGQYSTGHLVYAANCCSKKEGSERSVSSSQLSLLRCHALPGVTLSRMLSEEINVLASR